MFYKFILHVHFRRLIYTTDPQYPTVLASGTMPSLTLHVNEQKVAWSINVAVDVTAVIKSIPMSANKLLSSVRMYTRGLKFKLAYKHIRRDTAIALPK